MENNSRSFRMGEYCDSNLMMKIPRCSNKLFRIFQQIPLSRIKLVKPFLCLMKMDNILQAVMILKWVAILVINVSNLHHLITNRWFT